MRCIFKVRNDGMGARTTVELRAAIRNIEDIAHHCHRPTPPEELGVELRDHIHSLEIVLEAARERLEEKRRDPRRIS